MKIKNLKIKLVVVVFTLFTLQLYGLFNSKDSSAGGVAAWVSEPHNLCAADTATGVCAPGAIGFGEITGSGACHIIVTGTAPTSVTVSVMASINGTTFGYLSINGSSTTHTYTIADATTNTFSWSGQPAGTYKGVYVSKVGGDGTTAVTLTCVGGGI